MAFRLGRGGKRATDAPLFEEDQVIWGVPRRSGLDEQDDPKAHAGLTQHAFEPGNDDRAICGFEPPKRAGGPTAKPRAQLAVPNSRLNPRCPKCLKLIAVPVVAAAPAVIDEVTPADDVALADEAPLIEPAVAEDQPAEQEYQAPTPEQVAAERIGATEVSEVEQGPDLTTDQTYGEADEAEDSPDASIMAIVSAEPEVEPEPEPQPVAEPALQPAVEPAPPPQPPSVPPPPPPALTATPPALAASSPEAAPPPRPAVDPPMSMRSASWEGTVVYYAGQQTALVRPPSQPGMGVVASVISGPSGTRVGSVEINADGLAVISLSEPARGPVSVAWFAVPAVDENLRPGRQ